MKYSRRPKEESAMIFVLKALVPYTEANIMLAFKPGLFFSELEKISRHKRRTLEAAMYKAEKQKMIEKNKKQNETIIRLTESGKKILRPFIAKELGSNAKLMVIFDVPEDMSRERNKLRRALRAWDFKVVQKSVWVSSYDHRESLGELINELEIEPYAQLFECIPAKL